MVATPKMGTVGNMMKGSWIPCCSAHSLDPPYQALKTLEKWTKTIFTVQKKCCSSAPSHLGQSNVFAELQRVLFQ